MAERFSGRVLRPAAGESDVTPTMGEIGLNQFAPYLMNRIAARWNANMADELKVHDMTTLKMRTLAILSISSAVTINELAVYAVTEQSTMSRTLDALEEQGFIRRQTRADDMRVREVSITEEGRTAFEKVWPTMYRLFVQMFDGIDEEAYRSFTSTLQAILANIRKHEI
jgi:MarR family transcriptional regulator, transcriptional regulator for hemolysin